MMERRFQVLPLEGIVSFKTGKLNSNAAKPDGTFPFFTCSQETYRTDSWSFDGEYVLLAGNNAAGIYPLKYFNGKFDAYQRTYAIRSIDQKKLFTRYVYYALRLQLELMKSISTGVATKFLTLTMLNRTQVPVPLLATQRKIAAILSAYDDLIENNLRRIKILEEMAQNLYREWFVKFRFSGHQHARFTDSSLGRIPEEWEVKIMPDAVTIRPALPVPKNEQVPFVSMGSLSETSMLINETEFRPKASGARFQNGDTLFARITPCLENSKTGFVQFLPTSDTVACGSTEFIVLRSKTVCPEYVYLMARSDLFRDNAIKSMSGATGRQRVREECFDQFLLAQPPDAILERFQMATRPQFEMIHSLNRRNQNLRRTRDLLLPKLISGEVDVSALDITIPEEAEA